MKDGRYLGADPGIKNFAYAIIEVENGEPKFVVCGRFPNLAKNNAQMLNHIKEGMTSTIKNNNVISAGFEEVMFGRNRSSAMSTAKSIGALEMACAELDIECSGITASSLKKQISGNGRASKDEMKIAVHERLIDKIDTEIEQWEKSAPENDTRHPFWKKSQLENADDHCIDAVAVALWLTM